MREYFFNNWKLDTRLVGATLFSSAMSLATVVVALVQLAAIFGVALSWATITFCLGWLALYLAAPAIRRRATPMQTLHAFLGARYASRTLQVIASSATIVGLIGLYATELFAVDVLIGAFGFSPDASVYGVVAFGLLASLHAAVGGFPAVVRTDRYQTFLLLLSVVLIALLGILFWDGRGAPSVLGSPEKRAVFLPFTVSLGLFMINVPFPFVDTLAWQRLIAATDSRQFRRGSLLALVGFLVTWTILIAAGIVAGAALRPGEDAFAQVVSHAGTLGTPLALMIGVLIVPGLVAALLSQADAFLNSAAHAFCLDLTSIRSAGVDAAVPSRARCYAVSLGVVGLLVTIALRNAGFQILDMIFAVYAGTLGLFPSVIVALVAPGSRFLSSLRPAAVGSIVVGFLVAWLNGFYCTAARDAHSWPWSMLEAIVDRNVYQSPTYAFAASTTVFGLVAVPSYFYGKRRSKTR